MVSIWSTFRYVDKEKDIRSKATRIDKLSLTHESSGFALTHFRDEITRVLDNLTEKERESAFITVESDDGFAYALFGYFKAETEAEAFARNEKERLDDERRAADDLVRRRAFYERLKIEFEGQ